MINVCPHRDIVCGENSSAWCAECPLAVRATPAASAGDLELVHQLRSKTGHGGWQWTDADGETSLKRMPHWADLYEFRTLAVLPGTAHGAGGHTLAPVAPAIPPAKSAKTDTDLLDAVQSVISEANYMDARWLDDARQFGVRTAIAKALTAHSVMTWPEGFAPAITPHNFCPTCGKRTPPDSIHTCTPPAITPQGATLPSYYDSNGATRCSGCHTNHDLNQDHGEDCSVDRAERAADAAKGPQ